MSSTQRKIIHIDMDAFFAAIEQRDRPQLRGKPIAVGSSKSRGVVCTASYEARRFGVHSALPSMIALKRCPRLIFVPPRFEIYREVSKQIRKIFLSYTDLVEPLSLDEAFLDVSADSATATSLARELKEKIKVRTALTGSAGVSVNKFLAKVASDYRKPNGLTVIPPRLAREFAANLPVGKIPGIGKVTLEKLRAWGVKTGKDLELKGERALIKKFGKFGMLYYRLAQGIDESPVQPNRPRKSLGAEKTFPVNLTQLKEFALPIRNISQEVGRRLELKGLRGSTVTLKIKYHDFKQKTRSRTLSCPVGTASQIEKIAHSLLLSPPPPEPVRLLGITISNLSGPGRGGIQLTFLEALEKTEER